MATLALSLAGQVAGGLVGGPIGATIGRALGLEGEIGGLVPGRWADLAVLTLPGTVDAAQLTDTVLTRPTGDVYLTVLAGREVYRRGILRS